MADITNDDWYKKLKAQAAERELTGDEPADNNQFHVKVKPTKYRQVRVTRPPVVKPSRSIMEMHTESMARLRKRFMPPLRKD